MTMPRVVILADDLSGASDCGVACVRGGLTAMVSLGGAADAGDAVDVLSVDAHTRVLTAEAAADRMRELVLLHANTKSTLLFKKIDSTLRGHLGAELAAVLEARRGIVPDAVAIMAPAFPANGRTTVGGMHFVHGLPLHEHDVWKREDIQGEARIAEMVQGSGLRVGHLDLATVRKPGEERGMAIEELAARHDVLVCDAETDADLGAVASLAAELGDRAVWVGSAGLARHLVSAARLAPAAEVELQRPLGTTGSILFVIGSANLKTRHQTAVLLSSASMHGITVPTEVLLAGPDGAHWNVVAKDLCDSIEQGEDVLLTCGSDADIKAEDRPRLTDALAEMTLAVRDGVGSLVASGGETARKVLDRWGVQTMSLHSELETGVPISTTVVNESRPLTVITKAGDFGQPNTLLHCRDWLTQTRVS